MKELRKIWAWDTDYDEKLPARLLFAGEDGSCVACRENYYEVYLTDGLTHVVVLTWKHWEEIKEPKMRPKEKIMTSLQIDLKIMDDDLAMLKLSIEAIKKELPEDSSNNLKAAVNMAVRYIDKCIRTNDEIKGMAE